MDKIKVVKYRYMNNINNKYKKYMCANCDFFSDNECIKQRIPADCARKNLKNKA